MIDREGVAQREKRGEWRGSDDGSLDGGGLPPRAGFPSGRETEGSVNYLLTSLFPLFLPNPEGAHDNI